MIVQLRLTGFWGHDKEITERDEIGDSIGAELTRRDCGYFDGDDAGGGATNLFFCRIPETRWEEALNIALDELKSPEALGKAIIAKSIEVFVACQLDPEIIHLVVWPEEFSRKFNILRWSGD